MDIRSAIKKRTSVRHYERLEVDEDILRDIVDAGFRALALDDNIFVNFHLIKQGSLVAQRLFPVTGTRLFFGSAPHFIIATTEEKPLYMLNLGFKMEQMILAATQKGLGTCWIGGLFNEERIRTLLEMDKDERVIALTPIGYPDNSLYGHVAYNVIELAAMNRGKRKPLQHIAFSHYWNSPFQNEDDAILEALECARLAPSWANTQPWHFLCCQDGIIAVVDTKIRYANNRNGNRYYRLDMGIAMSHFYLSVKETGSEGRWHTNDINVVQIAEKYGIPGGFEVLGVFK